MRKKIIIGILVIVGGFLSGIMITYIFSNKNAVNSIPRQSIKPPLEASISADPLNIKAAGNLDAEKEMDKISKSIIKLSYTNNTSQKQTKINVRFKAEGLNSFGFGNLPDSTAKSNSKSLPVNYPGASFDIPDVDAGTTKETEVLFFARKKGSLKITATIKSAEGTTNISNPITINIE